MAIHIVKIELMFLEGSGYLVEQLSGDGHITRQGVTHRLKVGDVVEAGDQLHLAPNSAILIRSSSGETRIWPSTEERRFAVIAVEVVHVVGEGVVGTITEISGNGWLYNENSFASRPAVIGETVNQTDRLLLSCRSAAAITFPNQVIRLVSNTLGRDKYFAFKP